MFLAGVGFLVDGHQPHEPHQLPDTVAATIGAVSLNVPRHSRLIPPGRMLRMRLPVSE